MKKLFSLMLAVWMAVCALSVGASAADAADDGWSTYTGSVDDYATFTLKARGNEIKIEITSDSINGDELTCPGSVGEWWRGRLGKTALRTIWIDFEDGLVNDSGNKLRFVIGHTCGMGAVPHTVSLKNDVTFMIDYCANTVSVPILGEITAYKPFTSGYEGQWGSEECSELQLSVDGHTLTMSTTLPDQVVDYAGNTRELKLNSGNLTVNGCYTWIFGSKLIERIIEFFFTLFVRFFARFKR